MAPPRGVIASFQIVVRLVQAARDMLFDCLGRDTEAVGNLLVGALVKYPQRKCRAALRRQPIDRLLYEPVALVPEQLGLQRFAFDDRIAAVPYFASLHDAPMAVFVGGQVACRGKKKGPECRDRLALPIGAKERLLDDFLRRFTRPDEAPNVPVQGLPALGEELRENLGG